MRVLRIGLLVVVASLLVAGAVSAADSPLNGAIAGDSGGSHLTWDVTLPADTDVTITMAHWPCTLRGAVSFDVWSADGHLAMSDEADACTQEAMFNTGEGGPAKLIVHNYMPGMSAWYNLSATGITLPGVVPAAPAAPAAPVAVVEKPAAPMTTTVAAEPVTAVVAAPVAPVAPAAPAPVTGAIATGATIVGDVGGAHGTHTINVEAGKTYKVVMTYGTSVGGSWTGIGFKVWGPDGLVVAGSRPSLHNFTSRQATFTADVTGAYTVQVYNYHHGMVLFYSLEVTEEAEE